MADTTTGYVPRDYRRVCDQCGNLYNRSELHRKGPWVYCSSCDAPGDRIREEEDAAIARQRPFRILPVPMAKPLVADAPDNWTAEEAKIFDFVLMTAPSRNIGGATSPAAAAWALIYLCDIIAQGTRPAIWLSSARTKAQALYSTLAALQYGSSAGPSATVQDPRCGGFAEGSAQLASTTIAAGLAFVKAYSTLGIADAINGANRCATWLRHAQCGDLQSTVWHTVYPSGGSPYHVGGIVSNVTIANGAQSGTYALADTYAVVFLKALAAVVGASTSYGDSASTAYFSAATSATLTTMISEIVTFAETGPKDSAHSDANTPGLSTTAPKSSYSAYTSISTGSGSWGAPTTVAGATVAMAVAGMYAANQSDTLVTSVMLWLNAFTANAANATPSTNSPQQTLNALTGTYSPTLAPATSLTSSAPFTDATGAEYDLAALGLLAPVLAATNAAQLRESRKTLSPGQQYSTVDLTLRYLGPIGRAGFSLQPNSSTGGLYSPDVVLASQSGAVYRYAT
jgi:hypothetical protein